MTDPKWKRFEKLVHLIQKELAGDADVILNESVRGQHSNTDRQIDICIRKRVGQFDVLIAIECKDHRVLLDVTVVGEFATKVRDIRANKGAIVSSSGFTDAPITMASNYGLETFLLVDTESKDW